MEFLCKVCGRSNIENESEYKEYLPSLRKKNDKSLYQKNTFNNINLDKVDKILNGYVTIHKKKYYF